MPSDVEMPHRTVPYEAKSFHQRPEGQQTDDGIVIDELHGG